MNDNKLNIYIVSVNKRFETWSDVCYKKTNLEL